MNRTSLKANHQRASTSLAMKGWRRGFVVNSQFPYQAKIFSDFGILPIASSENLRSPGIQLLSREDLVPAKRVLFTFSKNEPSYGDGGCILFGSVAGVLKKPSLPKKA